MGPAAYLGWGCLGFVVLLGAVSSGLSGAADMFGMFALVVSLVVLVRGRVGWAHLRRRAASWIALAAAFAAFTVSGLAAPAHNISATTQNVAASHKITATAPKSVVVRPAVASPSKASTKSTATRPARKHHQAQAHRSHAVHVGLVITAAGAVLPNRARTPGAINPAVTQADIGDTICVSGWTSTIRPSSSVTTALKESQLASGYAYQGDTSTSDYEEDHLISLELGGAPSNPANLWPEPYNSPEGARVKDLVENKLRSLVCSHTISLATAQHAIAANWWTAYQTYGGSHDSSSSRTTVHHTSATTAPAPAPVAPGNGATARCADGTYSYAAHHQGACSHHGGVAVFYK